MSLPTLTNNLMQQQNIIINQVPHQIVTNVSTVNNTIQQIPIQPATQNETIQQTATPNYVGIQTVPVVQSGISPSKLLPNNSNTTNATTAEPYQVLTKARLNDLVRDIDSTEQLDEDVEDVLLTIADDFVENVLNGACMIAKHRHVNTVEVKDIQLFLNKNFNIWIPGFGTDELRPYKRSVTTDAHKHRLGLIRRAMKK